MGDLMNCAEGVLGVKLYVVGFAFDPTLTKVALIRKLRPVWQANKLNGIGGKIEEGESPFDAMEREFLEETGVTTVKGDWSLFGEISSTKNHVYCFHSVINISDVKTMEEEEIQIWDVEHLSNIHSSEIMGNIVWMIRIALDRIKRSPEAPMHFISYF